MTPSQSFSWRARLKSFQYASLGFRYFIVSEHNVRFHACFTLLMVIASCILKPSKIEMLLLIIVTTFVWVAEIINTCIEKTLDFISTQKHPQIMIIKDLAAASVLLASVLALIVGGYIFLPKLLQYV
jgi:diacylglycerol kinase